MFLDRVVHFGETLGDQENGRSPKKLKSLMDVLYVANLKVQVVSFNMILIFLRSVFLDLVVHFGENLGEQVKGHPTKKLKSLIELPYVTGLKVQVLRFNMNLTCVPRPSCPFHGKFGRTCNGSSNEKAIIIDRVSLCNAPESTGSKLQYDPYLISAACS